jgi:hypothetical protein
MEVSGCRNVKRTRIPSNRNSNTGMIPENFEIKKRLKPEQTIHFVLYPQNYFKIAEEFIRLHTIFVKESLFEKVSLWIEMVISPLISLFMSLYSKTPPSFLTVIGLQKCFQLCGGLVF